MVCIRISGQHVESRPVAVVLLAGVARGGQRVDGVPRPSLRAAGTARG